MNVNIFLVFMVIITVVILIVYKFDTVEYMGSDSGSNNYSGYNSDNQNTYNIIKGINTMDNIDDVHNIYNIQALTSQLNYRFNYVDNFYIQKANSKVNGVILSASYFFAIYDNLIGQYDKFTGYHVKTYKTPFSNMTSGIHYNGHLYVANSDSKSNTLTNYIQIFDISMTIIGHIDVMHPGRLTWIDRYDDIWWGFFAYYDDDVYRSSLIRFNNNWTVDRIWGLPDVILDRVNPYSISGGQFNRETGLLFMTGYRKEIYIVNVDEFDCKKEVVDLISIPEIPFEGGGIAFDTYDSGRFLWGTNSSNNQVIVSQLEYI